MFFQEKVDKFSLKELCVRDLLIICFVIRGFD